MIICKYCTAISYSFFRIIGLNSETEKNLIKLQDNLLKSVKLKNIKITELIITDYPFLNLAYG